MDLLDTQRPYRNNLKFIEYGVDDKTGFLIPKPVEKLDSTFQRWEYLARNVTTFTKKKAFRKEVEENLPQLDPSQLKTDEELYLAHLQLSIITAGYIWEGHDEGDEKIAKILPKSIAIPLYHVSQRLGIKPVISVPSMMLANWKLKEEIRTEEKITPENIDCIMSVPGSYMADWFLIAAIQTEFDFAYGIKHFENALTYAEMDNCDELRESLLGVTTTIQNMTRSMNMMNRKLSPSVFYNEVRPFLRGWGGSDNPLQEGLIYEGVSEKPIQLNGGSNAQSSPIQCFDALLGVIHKHECADFLKQMRNYMPPKHKQLIEQIERSSLVRKFVIGCRHFAELVSAYNGCVDALIQFRGHHMKLIKTYILDEQHAGRKLHPSIEEKGSGGVYLKGLAFFQDLKKSTRNAKIEIL